MGFEELGPGHIGSVGGRVDSVVGEYLPHGALADLVAEAGKFALDTPVSPCRVLVGESHDQLTQLRTDRRSASAARRRLCPVLGDSFAVPAQQRIGSHDPAVAQCPRKSRGGSSKQGPIILVEHGSDRLAAKHGILMTQHDDLKVLPAARTHRESSELGEESVQETKHERQGWRHRPGSAPTHHFSGHNTLTPGILLAVKGEGGSV